MSSLALSTDRVLSAADRLVVAAAHADLLEAERLVEPDRRGVGGPHLEERLAHARRAAAVEKVQSSRRPMPRQR